MEGIVRKMDPLGRVVIPKEFRKVLDMNDGDNIEITMLAGQINMKKVELYCEFCGGKEELTDFKDKKICINCLVDLKCK